MASTYARRDYPPVPEIRSIGVIGAGQMGSGIAQVAASSGYDVKLMDVAQDRLDGALQRIDTFLDRAVRKGTIGQETRRGAPEPLATGTAPPSLGACPPAI